MKKYRSMGFSVRNNPKSKYHINWKKELRSCLICGKRLIPKTRLHRVHSGCKHNVFYDVQMLRNFRRAYLNPVKQAVDIGMIRRGMKFIEM